jgi:hypothetical protein
MKAGREHPVPLSGRAVSILKQLAKLKAGDFAFPGQARGRPLSNMAMEMMLRRMKIENATVHGFRSSFRDWAGNVTSFPREVTETALAHVIGDKAEQAYRRGDALEKRRKLMDAWASYCEPKTSGNVVPIRKKARLIASVRQAHQEDGRFPNGFNAACAIFSAHRVAKGEPYGTGALLAAGPVFLQVGSTFVVPTGCWYEPTDGAVTVPRPIVWADCANANVLVRVKAVASAIVVSFMIFSFLQR